VEAVSVMPEVMINTLIEVPGDIYTSAQTLTETVTETLP
jgi:hypothetical protein